MSTTPSERTAQRRRLLKSAAAAPAIFVLPVGQALAASSLFACVDRGLEGVNVSSIPAKLPADQTDQWVREFRTTGSTPAPDPGNYLVYDQTTGNPVAYASCWNSVHASGPAAESGTNLIR